MEGSSHSLANRTQGTAGNDQRAGEHRHVFRIGMDPVVVTVFGTERRLSQDLSCLWPLLTLLCVLLEFIRMLDVFLNTCNPDWPLTCHWVWVLLPSPPQCRAGTIGT